MKTQSPSPKRGGASQIFGPCLLWPNGRMDQDATWHEGRPQPKRLSVKWGPSTPTPHKGVRGAPCPIFGPFLLWPNGWMHQDANWHGGTPQPRDFVLDGDPAPSQKGGRTRGLGAPPPIFGPCLLWPNGWMDQDATWRGTRLLSNPHCARWEHRYASAQGLCVRWGPSPPFPKRRRSPGAEPGAPNFRPMSMWPNGWMDQDGTWQLVGMEVGLGPIHIVLHWDTAPLPKKGADSQFSAHLYCGQTAGCIKMPLGIEVGLEAYLYTKWHLDRSVLSPGNFVLDRHPAPTPKGADSHPIFGPRLFTKRLHGSRCHLVRR